MSLLPGVTCHRDDRGADWFCREVRSDVLYGVQVKVLPCGHAAHLGERRLCRHLLGERADELDTFWILRGVGVEYDLCCAACGRDGESPELVSACEGCAARADNRWQVAGMLGEPEIRRRSEPVNAAVSRIALPAVPLDVAPVDDYPGQWLLLTDRHLLHWHAVTGEIIAQHEVTLPASGPDPALGKPARYRLHASPDGKFAVIAVDYRQQAVVVELERGRLTLALDRGTHHDEQTPFPVAFVRVGGQLLLAHATAWNRVDLSDPVTGALITPRQLQAAVRGERPAHYLDYFYGALYPSRGGGLIVSDGWVWSPFGLPRVWDALRWRREYAYEAEDGESARMLRQVAYYWDKPMCWLDETRLAISGIGADDEAMIPGVEIYDARSGALLASFAGPTGLLHSDRDRLYSSGPAGLEIWDIQTGENTGIVPGFAPTRYHAGGHELAAIEDGTLAIWSTR
jgi:hypothetical protein